MGDDKRFTLDGVEYWIDGNVLKVKVENDVEADSETYNIDISPDFPPSDDHQWQFVQEIDWNGGNGRFKIEGIWYTIEGSKLKYAGCDDNKLQ